MPKRSAGLLMYRRRHSSLEVFLVHPGGPFWAKKDLGAWSIPKGEYLDDEVALAAAQREFTEETSFESHGPYLELGDLKQSGGKIVSAWAFAGDCDPQKLKSQTFTLEWPPHSGRTMEVSEVDRGAWYSIEEARSRLLASQHHFLDRLMEKISGPA